MIKTSVGLKDNMICVYYMTCNAYYVSMYDTYLQSNKVL